VGQVDPSVLGDGGRRDRDPLIRPAHVGCDGKAADPIGYLAGRGLIPVDDHHRCTRLGQASGAGRADTRTTAGDNRNLVREDSHHIPLALPDPLAGTFFPR